MNNHELVQMVFETTLQTRMNVIFFEAKRLESMGSMGGDTLVNDILTAWKETHARLRLLDVELRTRDLSTLSVDLFEKYKDVVASIGALQKTEPPLSEKDKELLERCLAEAEREQQPSIPLDRFVKERERLDGRFFDVVFLAANPVELPELGLSEEASSIEARLRETLAVPRVRFRSFGSAGPNDLVDLFFPSAPDVLHFAGHGAEGGTLMLQTVDGQAHPVTATAFAQLIAARLQRPRMIVLNSCYSEPLAQALRPFVDIVVGMRSKIENSIAHIFAAQLYRALANGDAIGPAFNTACAALGVHNLSHDDQPRLSLRNSIDQWSYRLLDGSPIAERAT